MSDWNASGEIIATINGRDVTITESFSWSVGNFMDRHHVHGRSTSMDEAKTMTSLIANALPHPDKEQA